MGGIRVKLGLSRHLTCMEVNGQLHSPNVFPEAEVKICILLPKLKRNRQVY
jgi:hypothetical protein